MATTPTPAPVTTTPAPAPTQITIKTTTTNAFKEALAFLDKLLQAELPIFVQLFHQTPVVQAIEAGAVTAVGLADAVANPVATPTTPAN